MKQAFIATCCLLLGAGCVNLDAPPDLTRYFIMNGPNWSESQGGFAVEVTSVRLEPHLAGPRMVVRSSDNEMSFSDLNRWAGPLDANIQTALNGYLAVSPIGTISNRPAGNTRLFVSVNVYRFEGHLPDRATLAASWSVRDSSGQTLVQRRSEHTVSGFGGSDYEQLAKLLEQTVSMLADEIASAI